jgi:hypothetical protein
MNYISGVFGTDGWNKNDCYVTVGAIAGALWDGCVHGMPTHLSYDMLRLAGWCRPVAVYLEPGLTRLMGMGELPETEEERRELKKWRHAAEHRQFQHCYEENDHLRQVLSDFISERTYHICPGGSGSVALFETDLATQVFPEIFKICAEDRNGLVPLSCLNPIGEGVFQVGELILYAHPFLRRSFSRHNNLNMPFLERLQGLQENGIPVKIALDPSLVGLASTYAPPMEFEYWWGPKFDVDLTKIQTGVARYKGSDVDRVFYGIAHTEFWWQSRDGHHILETEELRDEEVQTEEVKGYFCRYAHSMVDEESGAVTHFDGAVRGYTDETILQRVDADLKQAGATPPTKNCGDWIRPYPLRIGKDFYQIITATIAWWESTWVPTPSRLRSR